MQKMQAEVSHLYKKMNHSQKHKNILQVKNQEQKEKRKSG